MSITIKRQVHFKSGTKGRKQIQPGKKPDQPSSRVPRIARLMALAIHFDQLLRECKIRDLAELARLGRVTRARVTQVMNLLNLAPEIQEMLLLLPAVESGRQALTERQLRALSAEPRWTIQCQLLRQLAPCPHSSAECASKPTKTRRRATPDKTSFLRNHMNALVDAGRG